MGRHDSIEAAEAMAWLLAAPIPPYQPGSRQEPPDEGLRQMRAVAVAGGDLGVDPNQATVLSWVGGAVTAAIGGFALWLGQRLLGKAAFQTAMNDGFAKLNDRLQVALDKQAAEHEVKVLALQAEIATRDGQIRNLTQRVESLTNELRRHGFPLSKGSMTGREPKPGATILPGQLGEDGQ